MKPKRLLSILLAAVLLSGCLCGVSLAAEVETETVALRPGHTVAVETADEFIAAYNEVYEKNSDVNCIRLLDNLTLFNVNYRNAIKDGNTPFMPGCEGTLLIRMPEGTCLDLNGCMLSMRANQGLDGGAKSPRTIC